MKHNIIYETLQGISLFLFLLQLYLQDFSCIIVEQALISQNLIITYLHT